MKAIVTGSFDPITKGHLEIVKYASENFDTVYVVALINEEKDYMFTMQQKKELIKASTSEFKNVIADAYNGLTADYMHQKNIFTIIRGVRNPQDEEYEQALAQKMKEFDNRFETVIIKTSEEFKNISSSKVREKIRNNEELSCFLHQNAIDLVKKYQKN
ncbi:MAG: pantetheine-phosphate adenylyltransferase [Clostridia bacterium]|nr:pantetheine-phosphate adenylyltransferase [Clostridia bacterium]